MLLNPYKGIIAWVSEGFKGYKEDIIAMDLSSDHDINWNEIGLSF